MPVLPQRAAPARFRVAKHWNRLFKKNDQQPSDPGDES
jgi:hypothetical protein